MKMFLKVLGGGATFFETPGIMCDSMTVTSKEEHLPNRLTLILKYLSIILLLRLNFLQN